jgi:hypothetical protein
MKAFCISSFALALAALPAMACLRVQAVPDASQPAATHLHLVLRVSEKGSAEVVSAAEVPGAAVLPDAVTGDYLWLASRDGRTLAAGSVPDPFASRGYAPPGSPSEEHGRMEAASIVVRVPGVGLDTPLDSLALELYRLSPAPDGSAMPRIDAGTVERLRKEGRLEQIARVSGAELASQIRRVGRKATP